MKKSISTCLLGAITSLTITSTALANERQNDEWSSDFIPAAWLSGHPLPKVCSLVFQSWYDAKASCPHETPVIEVYDFWTNEKTGFACMCDNLPVDAER